ncbi:hypothetical protein [Catellatospora vulcania]|uniref:hypothetical protein n=1 Tax=Catellatospora vulcania TaxID=1460450 RepID=UPI0012D3AA46|nr:hypothetical protein [Catellatospora vulcania]
MRPWRMFAALAGLALATALTGGAAQAAPPAAHDCITPGGANLNQIYGIEERIVSPPICLEVLAGERWVVLANSWTTAAGPDGAVYPAGYTPELPAPIDDFDAKFRSAKYVIDGGTDRERVVTAGPEVLQTLVGADGLPFSTFPSPALKPLRPGTHTFAVYIVLSAQHCDGLGDVVALNCLPAGESEWFPQTPFEVVKAYGTPGRP